MLYWTSAFRAEHLPDRAAYQLRNLARRMAALPDDILHHEIDRMLNAAVKLHRTLDKRIPTGRLNQTLAYLAERNPPPAISGRRFRIYYATSASPMDQNYTLARGTLKLGSGSGEVSIASPKAGGSCTKLGVKAKSGKVTLTCKKVKGKLVWSSNLFGSILFISGRLNALGEAATEAYRNALLEATRGD